MDSEVICVFPLKANLTCPLRGFTPLEPYLAITIAETSRYTAVSCSGGKFPEWTDILCFWCPAETTQVVFRVVDSEERVVIGEGNMPVKKLVENPTAQKKIKLRKDGMDVGVLVVIASKKKSPDESSLREERDHISLLSQASTLKPSDEPC